VSRASDRMVVAGFTVGWSAVRRMPEGAAYAMFERLADISWRKRGKGVTRLEHNLDRALGGLAEKELRELSRAGMRSYMRYYCDAFRMPGWSDERLATRFTLENYERLHVALAEGKGAIVSLPHSGNWDHAGAWAAAEFGGVTTVAERLKPEELFEKFVKFRRARNIEVLPHAGGDVPVSAIFSQRLREGKLVAFLGDRDLSDRGIEMNYLGGISKLPTGPAALAVDTGAPLFPGTLWYSKENGMGHIHEPLVVPQEGDRAERIRIVTENLARVFEQGVRDHPEDWHMLSRVYVDEPRGQEGRAPA